MIEILISIFNNAKIIRISWIFGKHFAIEVKFNALFYQNLKFLFKIWSELNSPQFFLAPLILRTIFMLRRLILDKNHIRAMIALYLSYKLLIMTFVTGPLVCPLGRRKWRTSLRESAFWLRESTNFYGIFTPHYRSLSVRFSVSIVLYLSLGPLMLTTTC